MGVRRRRGFTLTELLVVIAIIGVLVGLLTPAVVGARNKARQTQCMNNQKELSQAIIQYEAAKKNYPGYAEASSPPGNNVQPRALSWSVSVFPYLGRNDLYAVWRVMPGTTAITALEPTNVQQFRCPSDTTTDPWPMSYVGNCGMRDNGSGSGSNPPIPPDWASNGVFHNHVVSGGSSGTWGVTAGVPLIRQVKMNSSDVKDGTQQTILLTENLQAYRWVDVHESLLGVIWWSPSLQAGGTANATNAQTGAFLINEDRNAATQTSSTAMAYRYARPSSNHGDGVVVSFCDGHQQFLRETISYTVYAQLMTPDGSTIRLPGSNNVAAPANSVWYVPLNDDDFK